MISLLTTDLWVHVRADPLHFLALRCICVIFPILDGFGRNAEALPGKETLVPAHTKHRPLTRKEKGKEKEKMKGENGEEARVVANNVWRISWGLRKLV